MIKRTGLDTGLSITSILILMHTSIALLIMKMKLQVNQRTQILGFHTQRMQISLFCLMENKGGG